jgi:hypothetical protein
MSDLAIPSALDSLAGYGGQGCASGQQHSSGDGHGDLLQEAGSKGGGESSTVLRDAADSNRRKKFARRCWPTDQCRAIIQSNPKFTVYPEAGHDSWTEAYNDPQLYEWLLQQKRTPRTPEESKK